MHKSIMAIFFVAFSASAILALLKLAGILDWCWLAVSAPLLGFYILTSAVMYFSVFPHDDSKRRSRKR